MTSQVVHNLVLHSCPHLINLFKDTTYPLVEDDIPEDELQVLGEVLGEDEEDLDTESIPVRVLDNFVIFEHGNRSIVPVESLCSLPFTTIHYSASGEVRPHELDDPSELDDLEEQSVATTLGSLQRVELSQILDINLHHYDSESGLDWLVCLNPPIIY